MGQALFLLLSGSRGTFVRKRFQIRQKAAILSIEGQRGM